MMTKRLLLTSSAISLAVLSTRWASVAPAAETFEVTHTDTEWQKLLTSGQYAILRQSATERPFTSPLLHEERQGTFACAGCDLELFPSTTKFDSGTGWPSFWAPLDNAVGSVRDTTLGMVRTAVHCRRCGGHLHRSEDLAHQRPATGGVKGHGG